jgi:Rrf2 family protein
MFDLSSQYAIRAMIYLAQLEPGRLVQAHIMAKELSLPAPYLSKILQQMVKDGLTVSRKGPSGGFALARKPTEIRLYDLLDSFQKIHRVENCILGDATCSDDDPCALHSFWKQMRDTFVNTMRSMTLSDLVEFETQRAAKRKANDPATAAVAPAAGKDLEAGGSTSR